MQQGKLILLNGGSSAGKTSAAEEMQDMFQDHFLRLGIDRYWTAMPPKQVNLKTTEPRYMSYHTSYENNQPYFQIIPGIELDRVMYACYRAIKSTLDYGLNVISDQLYWKREWFEECCKVLHDQHVFFVGMHVSDEEGTRRENKRRTESSHICVTKLWPEGWHRNTARLTHKEMLYDFEIDNTNLSPQETAVKIIEAFHYCTDPKAFKTLYKKL